MRLGPGRSKKGTLKRASWIDGYKGLIDLLLNNVKVALKLLFLDFKSKKYGGGFSAGVFENDFDTDPGVLCAEMVGKDPLSGDVSEGDEEL